MIVNGNKLLLYVNNQVIGCLTSNSVNISAEQTSVTCKDNDGAPQILTSGDTATFPFEGNFDPASGYGFADLLAVKKNQTRVGVKQAVTDGLWVASYAYLTELNWQGDVNAASIFSGTFTGDGPWSYGSDT
jgi:hypothetical protein